MRDVLLGSSRLEEEPRCEVAFEHERSRAGHDSVSDVHRLLARVDAGSIRADRLLGDDSAVGVAGDDARKPTAARVPAGGDLVENEPLDRLQPLEGAVLVAELVAGDVVAYLSAQKDRAGAAADPGGERVGLAPRRRAAPAAVEDVRVCDDGFHSGMRTQCVNEFRHTILLFAIDGPRRYACNRLAKLYHHGVWQLGGVSWDDKAHRFDSNGLGSDPDNACPYSRGNPGASSYTKQPDVPRCLSEVLVRSYEPLYPTGRTVSEDIVRQILSILNPFRILRGAA
jgi:hypothetical protein